MLQILCVCVHTEMCAQQDDHDDSILRCEIRKGGVDLGGKVRK